MTDHLRNEPVVCSWSGGKDSALALHRAIRAGALPRLLVTMMTENGQRSRSHGLHRSVLEAQAEAIGVPIRFSASSWDTYTERFHELMAEATEFGATTGVFGDIDTDSHRGWVQRMCATAGLSAYLPLWKTDRVSIVNEVLDAKFTAVIVAVREGMLSPELLNQAVDSELLRDLIREGIDPAGENGEYHTLVTDGPIFRHPLRIHSGEHTLRDGVWFLDVELA